MHLVARKNGRMPKCNAFHWMLEQQKMWLTELNFAFCMWLMKLRHETFSTRNTNSFARMQCNVAQLWKLIFLLTFLFFCVNELCFIMVNSIAHQLNRLVIIITFIIKRDKRLLSIFNSHQNQLERKFNGKKSNQMKRLCNNVLPLVLLWLLAAGLWPLSTG